jgi:hypothetical protein
MTVVFNATAMQPSNPAAGIPLTEGFLDGKFITDLITVARQVIQGFLQGS